MAWLNNDERHIANLKAIISVIQEERDELKNTACDLLATMHRETSGHWFLLQASRSDRVSEYEAALDRLCAVVKWPR